jgi:T5SS/PEP-CTERM-associated repeat protein/autotransporter-associated beta strand protein
LPNGNSFTSIDTTTPNPTVLNGGTGTTGPLVVGDFDAGKLTIQNGGALTVGGPNFSAIGNHATGIGTVTVDGAGSTLTNNANFIVGFVGTGTLTIRNGGMLSSLSGAIGQDSGSTGTATVDGAGSTWTMNGGLDVGNNAGSAGTLTLRNGGAVSTSFVGIANNAGSNGMVTVDGVGSTLTITSSGALLGVGGLGTGTLTISNGGTVSAPTVEIANTAGSTGTLNIGAAAGAAPAAPGTLNTPLVELGAGTGTIVFNHTSSNYVFAPLIDGNGAVNVLAGTTILIANNSYTGPTLINGGGALVVDGSIVSPTTVNAGGLLAGTGTVGATSVANGGTLSPGHNGFGTLTVNGSLSLQTGSVYLFGVSNSGAGFTQVNGSANIQSGAFAAAAFQGSTFNSQYTILSATGGVTGKFQPLLSNSAVIKANLSYTADDVILNLTSNFAGGGGNSGLPNLTRNQTAVAAALDNAFNNGGKS